MTATLGRVGLAPCGHPGVAIIGQYYACSVGCDAVSDGVPIEVKDKLTTVLCSYCGSDQVERWDVAFTHDDMDLWHCNACGCESRHKARPRP